jgi:hypothetical protein
MAGKISKIQGEKLLRLVDKLNFDKVFELLKNYECNDAELNLLKMEFKSVVFLIIYFYFVKDSKFILMVLSKMTNLKMMITKMILTKEKIDIKNCLCHILR